MKNKLSEILSRFAFPSALILLGLVLILSPDSASVFLAKLFGYVFLVVAAGFGIAAFTGSYGMVRDVVLAILCAALGIWLLRNPLLVARGVGRIVGAVIAFWGLKEVFASRQTAGKLLSLAALALGVILLLLPMTVSRVVFTLCGVVVLVVGVCTLIQRLRENPRLGGGKPDIIDIE